MSKPAAEPTTSQTTTPEPTAQTTLSLRQRVEQLADTLGGGLVERQAAVRMLLLAALARQNSLMLGPPGTAKSLLARRLTHAFVDARTFEYLLTRFTTPDELFGPVSIRALKEEDAYRRKVDGYLPTAEVVFLDEVFKASSAILNSLLTVLNERMFHNGTDRIDVPAITVVGASNEVPQEEGLGALYDRFTLRLFVAPISDPGSFATFLDGAPVGGVDVPDELKISSDELAAIVAWSAAVKLDDQSAAVLARLKAVLAGQKRGKQDPQDRFYVSDRRWRQAVTLMKTSAYVHGRETTEILDCALLLHCLWNDPRDAALVARELAGVFRDARLSMGLRTRSIETAFDRVLLDMRKEPGVAKRLTDGYLLRVDGKLHSEVTDGQLQSMQRNSFTRVKETGLYWDDKKQRFIQVHQTAGNGIKMRYQHGSHWVGSAADYDYYRQQGYAPLPTNGEVALQHKPAVGVTLDLSEAHEVLTSHWDEKVSEVGAKLDALEAGRAKLHEELDARIDGHLFVEPDQVVGLQEGLVAEQLTLAEWRVRVTELQTAVRSGGTYVTQRIEAGAAEAAA